MDTIAWSLIDTYFKDNPYSLVSHHLDSYNDFFSKGIFQIFRENNPIRYVERETEDSDEKKVSKKDIQKECRLYLGGKDGTKVYFGKPVIYDEDQQTNRYPHYMYPNDARLRNMTYGVTIHYDIDVDFVYMVNDEKIEETKTFEKIYLGRFPIMLHSNLCILKGLNTDVRFNMGECRNDYGGYFIIGGKEKVILSQEKFGDNMLYVRKYKADDLYSYSCEVHSVSEDSSKPIRFTSAKIIAPDAPPKKETKPRPLYSNNQIVIDVPNVKKPIPLFILMRALGVISDKSIIEYCLLDLKANSNMVDLFIPSIHDANTIFTQQIALEFISKFTKRQTVTAVQDILMNYFLPHIGEDNYLNKAYFIGFMVNKLLRVFMGREAPTDRDNFKFKRIETSGSLIYDLFREYYLLQKSKIFLNIDKEFYYHPGKYRENFVSLIEDNVKIFFKDKIVEDGFKKGFKGNWGSASNTKRLGLVQDLNRLSWFTHISHLRKINLPLDPTAKIVGPHLLHSTQWGIIDPVDTPDGGNIGLHKHLSIATTITNGFSSYPIIKWLRANTPLKILNECSPSVLAQSTKVFVNGNWVGVLDNPIQTTNTLKLFRRNGIIPVYTSISFSYESNIIYIYTDNGRLTRPIFYRDMKLEENGKVSYGKISYDHGTIKDIIDSHKYTWTQVISGFEKKNDEHFNIRNNILYDVNELYPGYKTLDGLLEMFEKNRAIIDYLDTSEEESALISTKPADLKTNKYFTHCEIDPSLIFGVMGNSIIYPEANQFPRNCFSCGQSRQAVSVYHSNFQMRMDKMGVILNYGQTPLIKSRYLEYINREEQPYGVNAIVAIMSYTGYNVEDAILINEGSIKRGLFRTTYYTTYEAREESSKVSGSTSDTFFSNIESKPNVSRIKDGFDYSKLDAHGLVEENTAIDDRIVLIGELSTNPEKRGHYIDNSKTTKKGQLGFVDKSFMTEGEEGFRIAKIRIREDRLPAIGDKMASRAGQKGTLGLIIPEEDMPFTADGIRPDLIINPHALPSRMTIGQLIESLFGKVCSLYGGYGDCTAFATSGANYNTYGPMLTKMGYHHSGNEIMYNGFTGEQIYSEIYMGPTYYMRLKHMVKDKINYRATGKRNFLTRQTNQGRANDGGLKIGEMERDGILAHGISYFLNESYMVRGDEYYMAVCNKTGTIAVYNPDKNLFLSPFADGPLVFNRNVEGEQILDALSKFGRSFSMLRVPFALKLLIQELQVMNVQMRIITEDNVDQLMNLSYQSRNIDKLLHIDHGEDGTVERDIKEIIENYKKNLETKMKNVDLEKRIYKRENAELKQILKQEAEVVNYDLHPDELAYQPGAVAYQPGNPAYNPNYNQADFAPLVNPMPADDSTLRQLTEEEIAAQRAYEATIEPAPINVFLDPKMNDAFIMLNPERRAKILQMDRATRLNVMKGIMENPNINRNQRTPWELPWQHQGPLVNPMPADDSTLRQLTEEERAYAATIEPPPPINIFQDPNMNAAFNMLNGERQSRILQMEPELRRIVMKQIMLKSGKQSNNLQSNNLQSNNLQSNNLQSNNLQPQSGGGALEHYFNTLPANKKLEALKGAYNSMSTDFSKLAGKVSNPLTRIVKPVSMQEQLTDSLPLLSVETKDKIKEDLDTDTDTSSKSVSFASSTETSKSSSSGSTKKITIN
jgi:DNA-directed RNA polymerase II subunit RPB2